MTNGQMDTNCEVKAQMKVYLFFLLLSLFDSATCWHGEIFCLMLAPNLRVAVDFVNLFKQHEAIQKGLVSGRRVWVWEPHRTSEHQ